MVTLDYCRRKDEFAISPAGRYNRCGVVFYDLIVHGSESGPVDVRNDVDQHVSARRLGASLLDVHRSFSRIHVGSGRAANRNVRNRAGAIYAKVLPEEIYVCWIVVERGGDSQGHPATGVEMGISKGIVPIRKAVSGSNLQRSVGDRS